MTRINGKGPRPMTLRLERVEREADTTTALWQVVGGPQDGARLAVAVVHPGGMPLLATQTLLSSDYRTVLAEGPMDPRQALRMLPPAPTTTPEEN